ncbi:MAG TPA: hypothetical protein VL359_20570, partial [bacterium]|nr:hypothetical protein [bacterium]
LRAGAALNGGAAAPITVAPQFYLLAGAFFVLAHFLFATLSASVGAVSTSVREGSQLSALYTLFPVVPLWLMGPFLAFPSHPLWVALSIFPLTAPSMVIERSAVSDIPAGQVAASLLLLAACVAGGVFAGRRIFRTYLLMYGKRPGLGEIVRTVARRKEALS